MAPERGRAWTAVAGPLVALVTFAVMAGLAEVALRLAAPQSLPSQEKIRAWVLKDMYVADEAAGYRLAPHFEGRIERKGHVSEFTTNSLGLRSDEPGPKRGPRILAVGDSFTWGWGVRQDEPWIQVVGRELESAEVVNGGINGYGTDGALATLSRVGPVLEPDLVLLGFYWGNDPADNLAGVADRYEIREGHLFDLRAHERMRVLQDREGTLTRSSHLARVVERGLRALRERLQGVPPGVPPSPPLSKWEKARAREVSKDLIEQTAERARALGARFGVVWIPDVQYAAGVLGPQETGPRGRLVETIDAAGIPTLDLRPVIATVDPIDDAYLIHDTHFTPLGHEVAGHRIAEWIVEAGLLEAP